MCHPTYERPCADERPFPGSILGYNISGLGTNLSTEALLSYMTETHHKALISPCVRWEA